jgi:hypothetical protein
VSNYTVQKIIKIIEISQFKLNIFLRKNNILLIWFLADLDNQEKEVKASIFK